MAIDRTRRSILGTSLFVAVSAMPLGRLVAQGVTAEGPVARLAALERRYGGRLGVAILDSASGRRINHRGEERFPMLSTFKWLAAALVLARVDRGAERLERRIAYTADDLVFHSPATGRHVDTGMTLAELSEAAITLSDNTAGNLLLRSFGGPPALTAFARTLGDRYSRLDRWEPDLNVVAPGDLRDTTTPAAMLVAMRELLLGNALSPASRAQLAAWLVANRTGDARLRAGMPSDWRIGDKTGTNNDGVANDVAIAWPPGRAPLLVAAYYDAPDATAEQRNAVLAEVGRVVASL